MVLIPDGNRQFLKKSWKLSVLAREVARCAWRSGRGDNPALPSSRTCSQLVRICRDAGRGILGPTPSRTGVEEQCPQVGVRMPSYAGSPAHDLAHGLRKAMVVTGLLRVTG